MKSDTAKNLDLVKIEQIHWVLPFHGNNQQFKTAGSYVVQTYK
jgi:hypothetical protein